MTLINIWIKAARIKTLPFGVAPVCVGSALSFHYGYFSWTTFLFCFFAAVFLQVGTNYANDVFDHEKGADNQYRIGPIRVVASGLISEKSMKIGMIACFSLAFLFATPIIWKEGIIFALIFLCVVMIGMGYSGGPAPLAYLGLGEVTNLLFMASIPTMLMTYLQMHQFLFSAACLGICFGGTTSAVMCLNNLRDEWTDRNANKKTLVVRFGQRFGKIALTTLLIYPCLLPCILAYFYQLPFTLISLIFLLLPAIPLLRAINAAKHPQEFMHIFPKTTLFALAYILILSYGLIQ